MPKVLILFSTRTRALTAIADAVALGAESVKFTEVELRRLDDAPVEEGRSEYRTLESRDGFADYDALIIGVAADGADAAGLRALLEQRAGTSKSALVDKVASAFTPEGPRAGDGAMPILTPLLRQGMILVGPAEGADPHAARDLGARVAKVAEWIRHAKSHTHSHTHSH